jgi:hypothetical protein
MYYCLNQIVIGIIQHKNILPLQMLGMYIYVFSVAAILINGQTVDNRWTGKDNGWNNFHLRHIYFSRYEQTYYTIVLTM